MTLTYKKPSQFSTATKAALKASLKQSNYDADYYIAAFDAPAKQKEVADYVATSLGEGISLIQTAIGLLPNGGKIQLSRGTFEGESALTFGGLSNITVTGMGVGTVINRTTSTLTIMGGVGNIVLSDLAFNRVREQDLKAYRFKNVYAKFGIQAAYTLLDEADIDTSISRITMRENGYFNSLAQVNLFIDTTRWNLLTPITIIVDGSFTSTLRYQFNFAKIHWVGKHGAKFISTNNISAQAGFDFNDPAPGYGDVADNIFENITFVRSGTYDGITMPAARVYADGMKFINCDFINESIPATLPASMANIPDDLNGDRRHGIQVYGSSTFINCRGIASPNGFHNNRGWYIDRGKAKLYNCIGIGGGIGIHGHGILLHRQSEAELHNCTGYGYGACSAGIKFQGASTAKLIGCVGYAADTLSVTSHPDISDFYTAGIYVDYYAEPQLIDCVGFQGNGINSRAIMISNRIGTYNRGYLDCQPNVVGGYFGPLPKKSRFAFTKDEGQLYMTLVIDADYAVDILNIDFDTSKPAGVSYMKFEVDKGAGFVTLIDENTSTVNLPHLIPANSTIKVSFFDAADALVSVTDGWLFSFNYQYSRTGCYALYFDNIRGRIKGGVYKSNMSSDCIYIGASSVANDFLIDGIDAECLDDTKKVVDVHAARENLPIINSRLVGVLNNVTSFKSLTVIETSSNYK